MTSDELIAAAGALDDDRPVFLRTMLIEKVIHVLREQGWIVVPPSDRAEAEKNKWNG